MDEDEDIYENIPTGPNLYEEIEKLQHENSLQQELIRSLESDVDKLCKQITEMKKVQDNLTKNISELYKTAKTEIERKDRMIAELRTQLEQQFPVRKTYRLPIKRERDRSPLNYCNEDPSGKKMKYDENNQTRGRYRSSCDMIRDRSESKDKYRWTREQSSERERREKCARFDRHKYDYDGRQSSNRDERNGERVYKMNTVAARRDSGFKETDKKERREGPMSVIRNNACENESYSENKTQVREMLFPRVIIKSDYRSFNHQKTENEIVRDKPLNLVSKKNCYIENNEIGGTLFNNNAENETEKRNRIKENKKPVNTKVPLNEGKIEMKMNKTKINEVTKKLFERLEEDAKQEHDQQKQTCPVSLSLCNISEVPSRTEVNTETVTSTTTNQGLVNKTFKINEKGNYSLQQIDLKKVPSTSEKEGKHLSKINEQELTFSQNINETNTIGCNFEFNTSKKSVDLTDNVLLKVNEKEKETILQKINETNAAKLNAELVIAKDKNKILTDENLPKVNENINNESASKPDYGKLSEFIEKEIEYSSILAYNTCINPSKNEIVEDNTNSKNSENINTLSASKNTNATLNFEQSSKQNQEKIDKEEQTVSSVVEKENFEAIAAKESNKVVDSTSADKRSKPMEEENSKDTSKHTSPKQNQEQDKSNEERKNTLVVNKAESVITAMESKQTTEKVSKNKVNETMEAGNSKNVNTTLKSESSKQNEEKDNGVNTVVNTGSCDVKVVKKPKGTTVKEKCKAKVNETIKRAHSKNIDTTSKCESSEQNEEKCLHGKKQKINTTVNVEEGIVSKKPKETTTKETKCKGETREMMEEESSKNTTSKHEYLKQNEEKDKFDNEQKSKLHVSTESDAVTGAKKLKESTKKENKCKDTISETVAEVDSRNTSPKRKSSKQGEEIDKFSNEQTSNLIENAENHEVIAAKKLKETTKKGNKNKTSKTMKGENSENVNTKLKQNEEKGKCDKKQKIILTVNTENSAVTDVKKLKETKVENQCKDKIDQTMKEVDSKNTTSIHESLKHIEEKDKFNNEQTTNLDKNRENSAKRLTESTKEESKCKDKSNEAMKEVDCKNTDESSKQFEEKEKFNNEQKTTLVENRESSEVTESTKKGNKSKDQIGETIKEEVDLDSKKTVSKHESLKQNKENAKINNKQTTNLIQKTENSEVIVKKSKELTKKPNKNKINKTIRGENFENTNKASKCEFSKQNEEKDACDKKPKMVNTDNSGVIVSKKLKESTKKENKCKDKVNETVGQGNSKNMKHTASKLASSKPVEKKEDSNKEQKTSPIEDDEQAEVVAATNKLEEILNENDVNRQPNRDIKKSEIKCKNVKENTKKDCKSRDKSGESVGIEESDRVLRSATRRNSTRERVQKNNDETETREGQKKAENKKPDGNEDSKEEKIVAFPQVDLSGSLSVNLSHDGEIPVLHIEDCGNCNVNNNLFEPLFSEKDDLKNTTVISLENSSSIVTSSPVCKINLTRLQEDLNMSSVSQSDGEYANGTSFSNTKVSRSGNNSSISLSSTNNSVEKVFNTSSARKRRRVILKMVD